MCMEEMKMLHWMSGHTRKDKIRNKCSRGKVRVALSEQRWWKELHLRWFGHVKKKTNRKPNLKNLSNGG